MELLTKHGETKGRAWSVEYAAWMGMRARCKNPNEPQFKDYGGRGITVDPAWDRDFRVFLNDVGRRPDPTLTLDRIDNDGNYEPGNVRWATRAEQAYNTRNTIGFRDINDNAFSLNQLALRLAMTPYWLRKHFVAAGIIKKYVHPSRRH